MSSASNNKRSCTDSGSSGAKRQIRQKQLLIPVAKYGKADGPLKDITPDVYKDMKEVQAAVKSGESCLLCPDNHDLVFRNESKDGRRRAHFAHKHDCHNDGCNYIRKYRGKGESPEHLQAKLWFGRQPRVVFCVECEQVCGNNWRTFEVNKEWFEKEWTYKTEYRLTMTNGKYIWVDGAFIDESGVVQLVVEVTHTHGTTGDKLKWLQNQTFEFFEVRAQDVQNSCNGVVPIINQKNDHRLCGECEKRISEALDAQKKHDDAQKKHDDHVREAKKKEAIALKLKHMRQKKKLLRERQQEEEKLENARKRQENARKFKEEQQGRKITDAITIFKRYNHISDRENSIIRNHESDEERKKSRQKRLLSDWKLSPENKKLCQLFPNEVIKSKNAKGIHSALVLAFYPHQIYWNAYPPNHMKWQDNHRHLHEYARLLLDTFEMPSYRDFYKIRGTRPVMYEYSFEKARFAMMWLCNYRTNYRVKYKGKHIGTFDTYEEAVQARQFHIENLKK